MDDTIATSRRSASRESTDLTSLGVAAAAAAVRNGDITSEAYTAALLARAREVAELSAFITIDEAVALEAARDADKARAAGSAAPLLGVPLGVKDSYLTKGLPTSLGLDALAHFVPREDADGGLMSVIGVGAAWEPVRFWHFTFGPGVEYVQSWSQSMSLHAALVDARLTFVGGP